MRKPSRMAEVEVLIREIQRYLAYVAALRAESPRSEPGEKHE